MIQKQAGVLFPFLAVKTLCLELRTACF